MVDFILRHGNDLLAVECLRGFEVSLFFFFRFLILYCFLLVVC